MKTTRGLSGAGLTAAPVLFILVFLAYPMARILAMGAGPLLREGTEAARQLAQDAGLLRLLISSGAQAALSTLLTLLIGLPVAFIFSRFDFRGKEALRALLLIPFVLPAVVVSSAFVELIGSGGLLERLGALLTRNPDLDLNLARGPLAVVLAHAFYNTAIVVRIVGGSWSSLDPRLEEAARVLGAGKTAAFANVTLRLLLPSIAASCLLVFAFCFSSFGIVLMLGGPRMGTLETEIYRQAVYMFNLPAAAFLSIVQVAFTALVMAGYARLQARTSVRQNLKPSSVTARPPRTTGARALVLLCGVAPTIGLVLPMAALLLGSFHGRTGLTLAYWKALVAGTGHSIFWISPILAAVNSLRFALEAMVLSLALGIPAAYAIARGQAVQRGIPRLGSSILDILFLLPLGTSAVTLGFGFIVAWSGPPLDLRENALLIPVAHSLVALPLVIRSLLPSLRAIDPRMRDAAAALGAGPARVRLTVDLPMLRRAFIAAAAFAFTVSLGEFGATAVLTRPELVTLPVLIYDSLSRPGLVNQGQALALGSMLMLACGAGLAAIERVRTGGAEVF